MYTVEYTEDNFRVQNPSSSQNQASIGFLKDYILNFNV